MELKVIGCLRNGTAQTREYSGQLFLKLYFSYQHHF